MKSKLLRRCLYHMEILSWRQTFGSRFSHSFGEFNPGPVTKAFFKRNRKYASIAAQFTPTKP